MITDLLLKLTDRCNLNCSYCYLMEKNTGDISIKTIDNIGGLIDYIVKTNYNYTLNVHLSGGESTLIPIEKLTYILSKFSSYPIRLNLNTNGSFFSQDHANLCLKYNVHVTISLDGCKECHDSQRSNSYGSTFEAIKLMYRNKLDIGFISVVADRTINYLEDNFKFYLENNITNIKINDAAGHVSPSNYTKYMLKLNELHKAYPDFDFKEYNLYNLKENKIHNLGNNMGCAWSTCFSNFLSVNHVGDVTTCERLFGLKDKEKYIFANVNSDPVDTIVWNPERMKLIKSMYLAKQKCVETCERFRLCSGGCYHSNLFIDFNELCDSRNRLIMEV